MLAALAVLAAEERPDEAMFWKIRQEATSRSQILQTLHVLTDVYGPRLTGSPNLKSAGEWAVQQMTSWGLKNGHLEPWDFGRAGWANERVTAHLVSPVKDALVVEVLAWTPGTTGVARGQAVQITLPDAAECDRHDHLPRQHQVHDQGQDGARRPSPVGAGHVQPRRRCGVKTPTSSAC